MGRKKDTTASPETHEGIFPEGCPVCQSEARLAAEKYYLSGSFRPVELDRFLKIPDGSFLKHARATELNKKLMQNQDAFYTAVMDKAREVVETADIKPEAWLDAGIKISRRQDEIQGRIKKEDAPAFPSQIIIAAFPAPRGPLPALPDAPSGMPLEATESPAGTFTVLPRGKVATE